MHYNYSRPTLQYTVPFRVTQSFADFHDELSKIILCFHVKSYFS